VNPLARYLRRRRLLREADRLEKEAAWLKKPFEERDRIIADTHPDLAPLALMVRCTCLQVASVVGFDVVASALREKEAADALRAQALEDQARALREEASRP